MNQNQSIYTFLSKKKALIVVKFICAGLALASLILLFAAGEKIGITEIVRSKNADSKEGFIVFLCCLPFVSLGVTGTLWALSLRRAGDPDDSGSLLKIAMTVSQILSILAFIGCIYLWAVFASARKNAAHLSMESDLISFYMFFTIAGTFTIPFTSGTRTYFYNEIVRSRGAETPQSGGAGSYAFLKMVNFFYMSLISFFLGLFELDAVSRSSDGLQIEGLFGCTVVALLLFSAIANLIEARFALDYKRVFPTAKE